MLSASLIPAVVCTNICECRRGQMLATSTYRSYGANVEKRAQFIADQLSFGLSNVTSSFRTLNICRRRFISIATPPMNKKKNMKKPSRPIKMKYRWWNELNTRHDTEEKKKYKQQLRTHYAWSRIYGVGVRTAVHTYEYIYSSISLVLGRRTREIQKHFAQTLNLLSFAVDSCSSPHIRHVTDSESPFKRNIIIILY